jgi:hypothetical protein
VSEPIFEASVRLQADVADFETQAKASLQRVLTQAEQATANARRQATANLGNLNLPQRIIQPPAPQPTVRGGPGVVPSIVPVNFVPNTAALDAAKLKAAQPVNVPVTVDVPPVVVPPVEVPPVAPITVPVAVDQQAIDQALAQAQALAAAPLDIEVLANTKPFERDTAQAFARVEALAEAQVAQTQQVALAAAQESKAALDTVLSGVGDRTANVAASQAKLAVKTAANAAYEEAKTQLAKIQGLAEEARLRPATELQTQAELAAAKGRIAELGGDVPAQMQAELDAAVLGTQGAAEAMALSAEQLSQQAAGLTGTEQQLLQAQAEEATLAAEKLRIEAERLRAAGPGAPIGPPGSTPPGAPPSRGIREFLSAGIEGRSSGLAELARAGTRLGVFGIAATAAFQTVGELSKALRVTGDEAATAQGRFRNFGAEVLSFNPVGAIKALSETRDAIIDPAIKNALEEQKNLSDPLFASQQKLIDLQNKGGDALKNELEILVTFGGVSAEQANKIGVLTEQWARQQSQLGETTLAVDAYNTSLERAGGNAAKLFGPEQGGPGGIAALQAAGGALNRDTEILFNNQIPAGSVIGQQRTGRAQPIIQPDLSVFRSEDPGNALANQIRASITSRIANDVERAESEERDARILQKQARAAFEAKKKQAEIEHQVNGAADAWDKYVAATTNVANKTAAAKAATEQAAAESAALDARIRDAQTARILEPHALAQAELENANADLAIATKAFEARKSGTKKGKEARAAYEEAVTAQIQAQGAVNALAASDAETARSKAESAAASQKSAREQALANNITQAQLEGDKAATIKAFQAAISYYRALSHSVSATAEAREAAQSQVLQLRAGLRAARQGEAIDPAQLQQQRLTNVLTEAEQTGSIAKQRRAAQHLIDFWLEQRNGAQGVERAQAQAALLGARARRAQIDQQADSLAELRIRNRQALAQLNENPAAEKRAADDLVKFWQRQVKHAEGYEKAQAQSSLIAARLARKGLDESQDAEKDVTTVFDLLTKTADRFNQFAGDLITPNQPFTRESFVGEQAQFFRPGVNPGDIEAGPSGFTADLGAFRERNERLGKIPGSGVEQSLDRNTTATDRLTDALLGTEGFGKHGYDDGTNPKQAKGYAWSGGDFWKARQARQAAEAGVGATRAGF